MNFNILDSSAVSDYFFDVSRFTLRFASVLLLAYVLTFALVLLLTWRPQRKNASIASAQVDSSREVENSSTTISATSPVGGRKAIEPTPINGLFIKRVSEGPPAKAEPKRTHVNGDRRTEEQK